MKIKTVPIVVVLLAAVLAGCLDSMDSSGNEEGDAEPGHSEARLSDVRVRLDPPDGRITQFHGSTLNLTAIATYSNGTGVEDAEIHWAGYPHGCDAWVRPVPGDGHRAQFLASASAPAHCLVTATEGLSQAIADIKIDLLPAPVEGIIVTAAASRVWVNESIGLEATAIGPDGGEVSDARLQWTVAPDECGSIDPKEDGFKATFNAGAVAPVRCTVRASETRINLSGETTLEVIPGAPAPNVVVGIPDTGINPYHEQFYRPENTIHPCNYIRDFPCDIPALNLSIGQYDSYSEAYEADKDAWQGIREGDWYWIPQTVFVAVHCEAPYSSLDFTSEHCILDDHGHGTATASSVLSENPGALIAAKEGGSSIVPFLTQEIPVDIFSVSWGSIVPIPVDLTGRAGAPIYVLSAGNDPRSTLLDAWAGDPNSIAVGGAYAQGDSEELLAAKQPEVVSYFCRPTAERGSLDAWRGSYCGTSFAAPTVAGGLSKVVLAVRESSGYTGGLDGNRVDPLSGVTTRDLRDAMNRTASYDPEAQYPNSGIIPVPLNPLAPWMQWGWGFYDGLVADATIEHLLGIQEAPEKPAAAQLWMETMYGAKGLLHG